MPLLNYNTLSIPIAFDCCVKTPQSKVNGILDFVKWLIFSFLVLFSFNDEAKGQDILQTRIVIENGSKSTIEILNSISARTGIVFSYSNRICLNEHNDISNEEKTIKDVLDYLFRICPATYSVKGQKVIIEPTSKVTRKYVVRGYVRDRESGEVLIGANIYDPYRLIGQNSNNFGFYSLMLPEGEVSIFCSFVGCQTQSRSMILERDTIINFDLISTVDIEQIDILGTRKPGKVQSTATGLIDLPVEQIQAVPSFMGEADVMRTLQLTPGVQSGNEGMGGFYVRGGGNDENLIMLDDVAVYNVTHMLGFFSVFNADAINKVTLVKSGFPARYGGRLSSIIDIRLKEGNLEEYHGSASFGLLSSRLSVEGPLVKNKSSFYLSGRRTHLDLFSTPLQLKRDEKMKYYFYDLNGKLNYIFSSKDRLYVSLFSGTDEYDTYFNHRSVSGAAKNNNTSRDITINDETGSGWGSQIISSRWNHVFGHTMFMNLTLSYSNFRFYVDQSRSSYQNELVNTYEQRYYSGIRDNGLKADFDYFPSPSHHMRFGAGIVYHEFYPGIDIFRGKELGGVSRDTTLGANSFYRPEYHAYVEDDFSIGDRVKMNMGVHASALNAGTTYYGFIEPRLSALFLLRDNLSVKSSYTHMTQYIHLVRNSSILLPSDMWLPVSDDIEPLRSSQFAVGIEWEINKATSLSVEGYYKRQKHILTYRESAGLFNFDSDWASKLTSGTGRSYGLEIFFHKKSGNWAGWLSYTLSRTRNRFPEVNGGKSFPANFDRWNDMSLFSSYKFTTGIDLAVNWLYGSGYPVTLPTQKYYSPDIPTIPGGANGSGHDLVAERNSFRMSSTHRLDLGLNFTSKKSWGTRIWSFGVYNAYSRQNPFFLYFADKVDSDTGETNKVLKQYSLFPIALPYVRVTIKF